MNKKELLTRIADETQFTVKEAEMLINSMLDEIGDSLTRGNNVKITGFGTFEVKLRGKRNWLNPATGETLELQSRKVPSFRAGKQLKIKVGGGNNVKDY